MPHERTHADGSRAGPFYPHIAAVWTTVGVSKLTLLAHDYDSPEYAATLVQSSRPVFDLDYLSPNERDDRYGNLYDWLSQKFSLYQIHNGQPLLDYIVKEEYLLFCAEH